MKLTKEQIELGKRLMENSPSLMETMKNWDGRHGQCPFGACRGSIQCDLVCKQALPDKPVDMCPCSHLGSEDVRALVDEFFGRTK